MGWRDRLQPALALLRWEGVALIAALGFGISSALSTRWFFAFVLLSATFLYTSWVRALGTSEASERFRRRARTVGLWVWAVLLGLIGLAIFWRFTERWGAAVFGLGYLATGIWHIRWLARRDGELSLQFRQSVALSIAPILLAWFVNSSIYQIYGRTIGNPRGNVPEAAILTDRLRSRAVTLGGRDASIALTLSGGGYRAAAVHTGVLWTLDQAGLPVNLLSTVSGGSIVGASYAMGLSAAEFRDLLKRSKPGLTNDLTNFYPVFAQLFVPGYGSGDTYANHFNRVFFQGRQLEQTGPPDLIVNTTRYRDGTRRAFSARADGHVPLARLVAASGAFPVAFDPVGIDGELYVDGGVVENLGVGGLQQFLESGGEIDGSIPDVLILSDAGLIPAAPEGWNKPSVLQMALRAQQTSYFAMHRWIYSFYTDGEYDRMSAGGVEQPFEVTAGRLWPGLPEAHAGRAVSVFVLSPASPSERIRFNGDEDVLDAVSELDTLKELSSAEVDAAFWVGARLALAYLPGICAAAGVECGPVDLESLPDM